MNSLTFNAGEQLPEKDPAPLAKVISVERPLSAQAATCSSENASKDSPIQLYMPFSEDRANWQIGGDGSFYGDGAHTDTNNDYYATDWNLSGTTDLGKNVYPVADGVVTYVGVKTGYGKTVEIDHDGKAMTRYAHLNSYHVSKGQKISINTRIGTVGTTGNSKSPHLHLSFYGVKENGKWTSKKGNGRWPSPMWTSTGRWQLCDGDKRQAVKVPVAATTNIPDGTLVKSPWNGTVYLRLSGKLHPFDSAESFLSWGYRWNQIVTVTDDVMNQLKKNTGPSRPFQDGTLLKGSGSNVYFIEYQKKRHICSGDVFLGLGFKWENIVSISDDILNTIGNDSRNICSTNELLTGMLVKSPTNPNVYIIYKKIDKKKSLFPSAEIFLSHGYRWEQVAVVNQALINKYVQDKNTDQKIRDGNLIKGSGSAVYVIENGLKRGIPDWHTFEDFGYRWENIMQVSNSVLNSISTGPAMTP